MLVDCFLSCRVAVRGNEIGARDVYDTPHLNRLKYGGDLEKRFETWFDLNKGCDRREITYHLTLVFVLSCAFGGRQIRFQSPVLSVSVNSELFLASRRLPMNT